MPLLVFDSTERAVAVKDVDLERLLFLVRLNLQNRQGGAAKFCAAVRAPDPREAKPVEIDLLDRRLLPLDKFSDFAGFIGL